MPYFDPDNLSDREATLEDYAAIAADIVQRLAPVSDPEPVDYPARAARAERLVFNWLQQTGGGTLKGESVEGISSTFADMAVVQGIVKTAMGSYYAGSGFTGSLEVASSFPEETL